MTLHAFKGNWFYELQIGKLVFQVRHSASEASALCAVMRLAVPSTPRFKRINVWIDPYGKWF